MIEREFFSTRIKIAALTIILVLLTLSVLPACEKEEPETLIDYQTVTLKQEFSNNWSRWQFDGDNLDGNIKTEFSSSWDRWLYNGQNQNGQIRTEFSESWDRWNYYISGDVVSIRTEFSESWERWKINGSPLEEAIFIRTQFSGDNTRWLVSTASSANIAELKTVFSNDYRRWELKYDPTKVDLSEVEVIPMLFICVFNASVYEQEVIE